MPHRLYQLNKGEGEYLHEIAFLKAASELDNAVYHEKMLFSRKDQCCWSVCANMAASHKLVLPTLFVVLFYTYNGCFDYHRESASMDLNYDSQPTI